MGDLHPEELQALRLEASLRLDQLSNQQMEVLPSDLPSLIHELYVHKIALEMQNDKLQKANLILSESSRNYRERYEFAPIGFLSINEQGFITECNWKALSMFGLKHSKLNQYRFAQFVDDKDKSLWQDKFFDMKNQSEGEELFFEIQLINIEGVSFYANVNSLRIHDEVKSELLQLAVVDVTDLKLAAKKLKIDEDARLVLINTAMEGFWITDLDGQFLEVNATYCQMSGYKQSELLKMKVSDIEANESAADIAAHIKKVISEGQDRFDTKHRRKDGKIFDVRVNAQYMHSEGGRFVVFLQDISLIKEFADKVEVLQLEQQELYGTKQQLQTALDSDRNLSVAIGIVMGQQQVGKDAAMKLLRKRARD